MIKMLLEVVNTVRDNKGLSELDNIKREDDLRRDLELDSLDLAELTVRIESATGVDVFADSFVNTIGEILDKIEK